jgi:anti-sigma factor RsiW
MTDERHPDRDEERLDRLFSQLGVEKAPRSLTQRLHRIPREQGYEPAWRRLLRPAAVPRWVLAPALAAALLAVGVVLTLPRQPSEAEVLQARQELALAFHYIDKAGAITGQEIQAVLGGKLREELRDPVKDNLSKHFPFTEQSLEEEST